MDLTLYKDFKTSRGFNYHYYHFVSEEKNKQTLLLLHGFPSLSQDWSHVVKHFRAKNYGIIAPDLLGYGGTDKPTDVAAYRMKLMTKDIIEILDSENVQSVVAIGHDWGSGLLSRLAVYYPERFTAYAFLAQSYFPPTPNYDIDALNAASVEKHGYANFGYWKFFVKDEAPKIIGQHLKSFFTLLYGSGGRGFGRTFSDADALEKWLSEDKLAPSILDEATLKNYIEEFGKKGFAAPLCWYKAFVFNHTPTDDAEINKNRYIVRKPVFFGAALNDAACRADHGKEVTSRYCPNATVFEYDTGHWILQQAPEKLNEDIQSWLQSIHNNETAKL